MKQLTDNIWLLRYPLTILGAHWDRIVTVIRLGGGEVLVHSTGPFSVEEVASIRALGPVKWVVECASMHDGFTEQGAKAFPEATLFVPEPMREKLAVPAESLRNPPAAWAPELEVLLEEGTVGFEEHAFFHRPSRTLIVGDFVFNFGPETPFWTRVVATLAVGKEKNPGMSRAVRALTRDKAAFRRSAEAILAWDFDRVIPGHREVIETGGKAAVEAALRRAGVI
jgi:hypothetical protein